jgi:lipopolysaccharide export system protein LptA
MKSAVFTFLFLTVLCLPCLLLAEQDIAVRIAVLPFEVFSMEQSSRLGQEIAIKLTRQLALNPKVVTSDFRRMQSLLKEREARTLDGAGLRELAKALDANFILFGSVTKIQEDMSIDIQLFNNFDEGPYFKTFAEGTNLDDLVVDVATKVEERLMSKAALIPPSQRPKIEKLPDIPAEAAEVEVAEEIPVGEEIATPPEEEVASEIESSVLAEADEEIFEEPMDEPFIFSEESQKISEEAKQTTVASPIEEGVRVAKKTEEASTEIKERAPFAFEGQLNINADSLEYDNKENRVVFKGNVVARQGDSVIFADSMQAQYSPDGKLQQMAALGGVKMIQGERVAVGEKLNYFDAQQKVILTGNPRVWQGDNVVHGKKITVYLNDDRYVVEGSPENRVTATLYPQTKEEKKSQEKLAVKPQKPDSTPRLTERDSGSLEETTASTAAVESEVIEFLKQWRNAWAQKEVERYLEYYARDFSSDGKNRAEWGRHKMGLFKRKSFVKIEMSGIEVSLEGDMARVTFIQKYYSDDYSDYGMKSMELVREENAWKISREEWKPLSQLPEAPR